MDKFIAPTLPNLMVPPCFINDPSILKDWRYESRHNAQQVVPNLWLGPLSVVRDDEFLNKSKIGLVISLLNSKTFVPILQSKFGSNPKFHLYSFDPMDPNQGSIVSRLPQLLTLIRQACSQGVGTLLLCETGNEKSPIVAAAYLINYMDYDTVSAIQYVQSKRFSIALDTKSKYDLQTFECISRARGQSGNPLRHKKSRTFEEDEATNTVKTARCDW